MFLITNPVNLLDPTESQTLKGYILLCMSDSSINLFLKFQTLKNSLFSSDLAKIFVKKKKIYVLIKSFGGLGISQENQPILLSCYHIIYSSKLGPLCLFSVGVLTTGKGASPILQDGQNSSCYTYKNVTNSF